MPSYTSKLGEWKPGRERVVLPHAPRGKEVYEGPDRAALWEMQKAGLIDEKGNKVGEMGVNYKMDPELIIRAKNAGFPNVDEYLKVFGFDEQKALADFEKKHGKEIDHNAKQVREAIRDLGGGKDTTGNSENDYPGGFGTPKELKG
jgi:hypothetical protein